MKANKATLGRSLDAPDPAIRFYLFYGQDEAGSRALAERLLKGLRAEKVGLAGGSLKSDTALLASEAGAISMFGERRALWIEPAGEEIVPAVEALFDAAAVESPAIAIAGNLKKTSALLKLAEAGASAWAHPSYPPDERELGRLVAELGRAEGLRVAGDVASRLAAASGGNQAVVASELAKFALFLGATPEAPKDLDHETVDRLGADTGEGDWMQIADLALDGEIQQLCNLLQRLPGSAEAIPIVRSLQRRLLQLATLRARIEAGERLDNVLALPGKPLFWKDKALIQRLLSRWTAAKLSQLGGRAAALEKRLMLSSVPGEPALGEELVAIARAARR